VGGVPRTVGTSTAGVSKKKWPAKRKRAGVSGEEKKYFCEGQQRLRKKGWPEKGRWEEARGRDEALEGGKRNGKREARRRGQPPRREEEKRINNQTKQGEKYLPLGRRRGQDLKPEREGKNKKIVPGPATAQEGPAYEQRERDPQTSTFFWLLPTPHFVCLLYPLRAGAFLLGKNLSCVRNSARSTVVPVLYGL